MRTTVLNNCDLLDGRGTPAQHGVDVIVEGDTVREIVPSRPRGTYETVDEIIDAGDCADVAGGSAWVAGGEYSYHLPGCEAHSAAPPSPASTSLKGR